MWDAFLFVFARASANFWEFLAHESTGTGLVKGSTRGDSDGHQSVGIGIPDKGDSITAVVSVGIRVPYLFGAFVTATIIINIIGDGLVFCRHGWT